MAASSLIVLAVDPQFCVSGNAVVATSWINTIICRSNSVYLKTWSECPSDLGWFITVIIYGTTRSCSDRDIWFKGIKDVDLRPNNIPDPTINEKIARLPALHHRPEVRTSEYSVSTVKMEKDDVSIVMPYHHRNGPIGVNAINGTPAYHPYSTTNTWNQWNAEQSRTTTPASVSTRPADSPQTIEAPPRRPFIVARPHGMSTGRSSIPSANAGSNRSSDIEWVNNTYRNTDSPSPAVIMQAHKVPAQQVLYGAHITGTKEKRRTRSNTDPAREGWLAAPSREQRNQSSILLVNDRRPSEAGVGLSPQISMGSAPMFSTDSAFGVKPKKPKHRPPPLDLSRLSNIKQAERR